VLSCGAPNTRSLQHSGDAPCSGAKGAMLAWAAKLGGVSNRKQ